MQTVEWFSWAPIWGAAYNIKVSINTGLAHDHCSTWVSGFKSSYSCFCMPSFLHCDRVSPKTQSVHDDVIDGWCGETEDPASVCLFATTTRTWRWNISSQVRLISRPHFSHLGGCKIGLAETVNGSEWTGSNKHTDRPSELIYRIYILEGCNLVHTYKVMFSPLYSLFYVIPFSHYYCLFS